MFLGRKKCCAQCSSMSGFVQMGGAPSRPHPNCKCKIKELPLEVESEIVSVTPGDEREIEATVPFGPVCNCSEGVLRATQPRIKNVRITELPVGVDVDDAPPEVDQKVAQSGWSPARGQEKVTLEVPVEKCSVFMLKALLRRTAMKARRRVTYYKAGTNQKYDEYEVDEDYAYLSWHSLEQMTDFQADGPCLTKAAETIGWNR